MRHSTHYHNLTPWPKVSAFCFNHQESVSGNYHTHTLPSTSMVLMDALKKKNLDTVLEAGSHPITTAQWCIKPEAVDFLESATELRCSGTYRVCALEISTGQAVHFFLLHPCTSGDKMIQSGGLFFNVQMLLDRAHQILVLNEVSQTGSVITVTSLHADVGIELKAPLRLRKARKQSRNDGCCPFLLFHQRCDQCIHVSCWKFSHTIAPMRSFKISDEFRALNLDDRTLEDLQTHTCGLRRRQRLVFQISETTGLH